MNKEANIGLSTIIIIIAVLLIATTAASVMTNTIKNTDTDTDNSINTMISEIVNEVTTYIQIKDIIGRYTTIENQQRIRQIALLIKPLISSDIDISGTTIKLCNGYQVMYLSYSGEAGYIGSNSLFNHPVYNLTPPNTFSIIIINDKDQSILNYHIMNDQSDIAYMIITLPEDIAMRYDESLTITLIPPTGYSRTVILQAPLPIRPVVTLN